MVRPIKQGLDYFPTDVAFLTESKVWLIKQKCGLGTMDTLMTLLSRIYGEEGYFMPWNTEVLDLVAYHGQVPHEQVLNVVEKALAVGFFDLESFRRHRILTAVDIQKKFITATRRRKTVFLNKNYLLISESERENLVIGEDVVALEAEALATAESPAAEDLAQLVQQTATAIKGYEAGIGALLQEPAVGEECVLLEAESGTGEWETALAADEMPEMKAEVATAVAPVDSREEADVVAVGMTVGESGEAVMAAEQPVVVEQPAVATSGVTGVKSATESAAESAEVEAVTPVLVEAEVVVAQGKTPDKSADKFAEAEKAVRTLANEPSNEPATNGQANGGKAVTAREIAVADGLAIGAGRGKASEKLSPKPVTAAEKGSVASAAAASEQGDASGESGDLAKWVLQKTASFALWQQLWAGPNVATQAELTRLLRNYGDELVVAVLKIASAQQIASSCSLPFVKGYLKRWQQAGVTDVAQARAFERECLQKNEAKRQQLTEAQHQAAEATHKRRRESKQTTGAKGAKGAKGTKDVTPSGSRRSFTSGKNTTNYGRDGRPYRRQPVEDWAAYPDGREDRQGWLKMLKKMQQLTPVVPQAGDSYQLTEAELAWIHDETQGFEAAVYRQAAGVWK
ncbi:Lin1244/Lin1753 domain-containing protein [Enterococcus diestrammenae]|uniref:Lin1244/Lin1753 domain-containing protein n=1 Tax=Enterococcus diestrammenae TaxID=1155073 RepID=UPI0022E566F0|nr:Lin1244/Lin1753 domain-containing protein [Enterococcus diestrammenae]